MGKPGLEPRSGARIERLLRETVVEAGVARAACAGVASIHGSARGVGAAGACTPRSLFDLASITKPVLALTAVALAEAGELDWAAPLRTALPELDGTFAGARTFEQLLSHRSGLVAHVAFFETAYDGIPFDRRAVLRELGQSARPEATNWDFSRGDAPPLYSDLGYQLAGEAIQRLQRLPLDEVMRRRTLEPLGLEIGSARQFSSRDPEYVARAVPTEYVPAREGLVRGIVHDDNAWILEGHGSAGHAGLFGTIDGVLELGLHLLRASRSNGRAPLDRVLERRPGGSLRLGLDGNSGAQSLAGSLAGPDTFGHLGFTGTSFWCDPDRGAVTAFLSNRVCPTRMNARIRSARPTVHDALWTMSDASSGKRDPAAEEPPFTPGSPIGY